MAQLEQVMSGFEGFFDHGFSERPKVPEKPCLTDQTFGRCVHQLLYSNTICPCTSMEQVRTGWSAFLCGNVYLHGASIWKQLIIVQRGDDKSRAQSSLIGDQV